MGVLVALLVSQGETGPDPAGRFFFVWMRIRAWQGRAMLKILRIFSESGSPGEDIINIIIVNFLYNHYLH